MFHWDFTGSLSEVFVVGSFTTIYLSINVLVILFGIHIPLESLVYVSSVLAFISSVIPSAHFSLETLIKCILDLLIILSRTLIFLLYFLFFFLHNVFCILYIDAVYKIFSFFRHFSISQFPNSLFCCVNVLVD